MTVYKTMFMKKRKPCLSSCKIAFNAFFILQMISSQAQSPADYIATLKQDITDTITESGILNAGFFNHSLFLLGESHGIQKPQQLDFNLLKLLQAKAGVHTYVGEFDFAKAYYLNQYLQTGNEKLLDTVFSDWVTHYEQWGNKDFQQKIRNIRALNKTLPAARQIRFAGIDRVHNPGLVADYFTEVLQQGNVKPLLPRFAPLINQLRMGNDSVAAAEAQRLLTSLNSQNNQGFKQSIYQSLLYGLYVCSAMHTTGREVALYNNFKYLYQQLNWKGEKLYGFWGFAHVMQARTNGGKGTSFAIMLQNDSSLNLKGKIVSIACLYSGSKIMLPTQFLPPMWQDKDKRYTASDKFNNDSDMMNISLLSYFKEATQPGRTTLFQLAGNGSPFTNQKITVTYSPFMPPNQQMQFDEAGKYLTDYMQYLILVRDSPATRPIME